MCCFDCGSFFFPAGKWHMFCENFKQSCVVHEYNSGIFIASNWIWSNQACIQGSRVCIRTNRDGNSCLGRGREGKRGRFLSMKGKLSIYTAYTLMSSILWSFSIVRNPVVPLCRTVGNACYFMNRQLLNVSLLIVILSRIICVTPSHCPLFTQDLFSGGKSILCCVHLQSSPSDAINE